LLCLHFLGVCIRIFGRGVRCGEGLARLGQLEKAVAMLQQQQRQWRWADDEDDDGEDDDYTEEGAMVHQQQQWDSDAADGGGVDGDALADGYQMLEELGSMLFSYLYAEMHSTSC